MIKDITKVAILLSLAFASFSCTRIEQDTVDDAPSRDTGTLSMTVFAPGTETKSATVGSERQINDLKVLVFDSREGFLENTYEASSVGASATTDLSLTTGDKIVWAYANYDVDAEDAQGTLPVLGADLSLCDFALSSFPMRVKVAPVTIEKDATTPVAANLERVASRVVITNITNNLPSSTNLVIHGAYLSNVLTKDHGGYDVSADPSDWISRWGRDAEGNIVTNDFSEIALGGLTAWYESTDGLPHTITNGSTYTPSMTTSRKGPRFYYIPGGSGDAYSTVPDIASLDESAYTPTETNLVIVASIEGEFCYYPIPITETRSNISTELSITLNNIGSYDPALPCKTGAYTLSGSIKGWEEGADYQEIPDGSYRPSSITRTGSRQGTLYIAQYLTLRCNVSNTIARWKDKISFSATVETASGDTVSDTESIKTSFDGTNWNISYACNIPGDLTIVAKDPAGREIGKYTTTVNNIFGYNVTSVATKGIPIASTTPSNLAMQFMGNSSPSGTPTPFTFNLVGDDEASGANYLNKNLAKKYLVPAVKSYSSSETEQMFDVEIRGNTSEGGGTRLYFAGITIEDFVSTGATEYNNALATIIWNDIVNNAGGSATGAAAGSIVFENCYGQTATLALKIENPWYGEYDENAKLRKGFYWDASTMTPQNCIFDYKIQNETSFQLYTLASSSQTKSLMDYELRWCKTTPTTLDPYCGYIPDGNSPYRIYRDLGNGNQVPFIYSSHRFGGVVYNSGKLLYSAESAFGSKLNAGGLAYINASISDGKGNIVSFPIGGVTFVKCFKTDYQSFSSTQSSATVTSVSQTVGIYPDPRAYSQDITEEAYTQKWYKSDASITSSFLNSITSTSGSSSTGYTGLISYSRTLNNQHDSPWYARPNEDLLYKLNKNSSVYNPVCSCSVNSIYVNTGSSTGLKKGDWYRFYLVEYPSNLTITYGDSQAVSNGYDAFNLSSTKEYDTYRVSIERNDANLALGETPDTRFVCVLSGVQGSIVGLSNSSSKTASNSTFSSSSTTITLASAETSKSIYIRAGRTPGYITLTVYPEGKEYKKRTVVMYNTKDIAIEIDGEFIENTVTMQNDMSAGQSAGAISNWTRYDYKYNKTVKVLPGKICNHCHIGFTIGWGGHVIDITAQVKALSVKSSWGSTTTNPSINDITYTNFTSIDYPSVQFNAGAYVSTNANSPFRFAKMVTSDISIGLLADHKEFGYSYYLDLDPRPAGNTNYYDSGWGSRHAYSGLTCLISGHPSTCAHVYSEYFNTSALSSQFFYSSVGSNSKAYDGSATSYLTKNKTSLTTVAKTFRYANDNALYFTAAAGNNAWHQPQGTARLDVANATGFEARYKLRLIIHKYRESAKTDDEHSRYWWYPIDDHKNQVIEKYTSHPTW